MPWNMNYRQNGSDVVKHTFDWVSDAGGNATVASDLAVSGKIERVVIVPSASAAPTALYDMTLTGPHGIDLLAAQGANLSDTLASHFAPAIALKDGTVTAASYSVTVDDILTLNVSNAGNAKAGKVVVYVR
jgi:hypothetical protein